MRTGPEGFRIHPQRHEFVSQISRYLAMELPGRPGDRWIFSLLVPLSAIRNPNFMRRISAVLGASVSKKKNSPNFLERTSGNGYFNQKHEDVQFTQTYREKQENAP